jgi:hypothetical protein
VYEVYLEFSAGIDRQNGIAIAEISNQIADSATSLCWLYLVTLVLSESLIPSFPLHALLVCAYPSTSAKAE